MKTIRMTKASNMSRTFSLLVLMCVGGLWAVTDAAGQNLITNGGFESPGGNGSAPTGWTADFNSYGTYSGAAHSGSWGLHAGNSSDSGGRYQDITTVPGTTYTVSVWAQNFNGAAGSSHLDVLIGTPGDGSHTFTFPNYYTMHTTTKFAAGVTDNSFLVGGAWQQYTFTFTAAATTTRIGLYNSYKTGDTVHSINVDDVSVNVDDVSVAHQLFTDAASSGGKFADNWSAGTQFTTGANPIYVTHLGYVDWNSADNGFGDGFTGSPQVGLWQGAHGDASPTLITTVTIPTGTAATLVGKFRYVTLPTPITLQPNTTYQLMGYGYSTDPTVHWSAGSGTVDPTLGVSGFRAEAHSGGLGFGDLNGPAGWTSPNVATSANFIWSFTAPSFHEGTLISFF